MASKIANLLYARIEPNVKEQAENILSALGIPFDVKLPSESPISITSMSEEQLNAELEKGYSDMLEGRAKPVKQVFSNIREKYDL